MPLYLGVYCFLCLKCHFLLLCLVSQCSLRSPSWKRLPRLSEMPILFPTAPGLLLVPACTVCSVAYYLFVLLSFEPSDVCRRVPSEDMYHITPELLHTPTSKASAHLYTWVFHILPHLRLLHTCTPGCSTYSRTWGFCTILYMAVLYTYTWASAHSHSWGFCTLPVPCSSLRSVCAFPPHN